MYKWADVDGVIVMRPANVWNNRTHFLSRRIASFELLDKNIAEALGALRVVLGESETAGITVLGNRSVEGRKPFTVQLHATTGLDVLNAVVRSHGSIQWELEYCADGAMPSNAKLWLSTSDGVRIGATSGNATTRCR